jgi:gliding motility-associated-like protein
MKHINPACSSSFFRKTALFSFLFFAFNLAHSQCFVPYAEGDADTTQRNVPVYSFVTQNDYTYYNSGNHLINDSLSIIQNPLHGTLVILNDSVIEYIPDAGFVGNDFYVYNVCNACGNCAQATVALVVNYYCPAPNAVADHFTVYNNVSSTLNVTANDQNIAGGPLTISILRTPLHGTATLSGGQIIYTPTGNTYVGADTLIYVERDSCPAGSNMDTAYVYLNVITCVPVIAVNDTFTVQQQSSVSGNLAANDQNVTGFGNVTVTLLNNPKFGGVASIIGTTITYTGGSTGYGKDSIKYRICTDCGCDTAYAIFNVTQKPCDRPIAVADTEYAGYQVTCTNIFNITANDTIPINGGPLTVILVSVPSYGSATITNGVLHYVTIDSTHAGQTDHVRYSICNACYCDTATVTINISHYPCNGLAPVIKNDTSYVCRNYSTNINVGANDYSPQGLTLAVTSVSTASHGIASNAGGSIHYAPDSNFCGADQFTYQSCDNGSPSLCNTATVTVFVECCNAAPVILNSSNNPADTLHVSVVENSNTVYCINYSQADSPYVYVSYISASADTVHSTSSTPGTNPCIYIASPYNSKAQQSVNVVICNEQHLCDTVLVIISVIPVDSAPVAINDYVSYNWSSPCTSVNALINDHDVDPGDHFTITAHNATTSNGGRINQTGDSTFCYTADSSFTGIDSFSYTICDTSGKCSTAYVIVTVPIQVRNDEATTKQDSSININVTANDTRTANDYISFCQNSNPQHGNVTIDSGNIILYTPAHDYPLDPLSSDTNSLTNGVDSFCYTLCAVVSGDTNCASAEVYITIMPKAALYIPQGMSPNGDGVNDFFVISSVDEFPLSQLLVYNRYGDEVWRNDGDGYQNNFDGTWKKNGQPLPDGSYWYIFKFNDGVTHDRMGYIVIQR